MAIRDINKEQATLSQFGSQYGRMPSSSEDWDLLHQMTYGADMPEEFKKAEGSSLSGSSLSGSVPTATPLTATPSSTNVTTAQQQMEQAQEAYRGLTRPSMAYKVLEDALKAKISAPTASIGESELMKQAGIGGYGALSSSLATRGNELKMNLAQLQNMAKDMTATYRSQYDNVYGEYQDSVKSYEYESARLDALDQDLRDKKQQLDILAIQNKNSRDLAVLNNQPSAQERFEMGQSGYDYDKTTGDYIRNISSASAEQIANAIKQVESGGNYSAKGGSGEYGAYQFMPATWNQWSQEYAKANGINQSIDQSQENQDSVAQFKIQQWLNQGYSPEQIASMWNSGSPEWEGKTGINRFGINYDVPGYVNKVSSALRSTLEEEEPLTGTSDEQIIAQAIIDGLQPPILTGLYSKSAGVKAELARQGYDLTSAYQDWIATQKYISTLNSTSQVRLRQATQFAYDSLDVVEDLSNQWERSNFPILNKAQLSLAKNGVLGTDAQKMATQMEAQITDLVSELGTVFKGGNSSTDESLKLAAQQLSADWSAPQLQAAIDLARSNLRIRLNSISQVGVEGTGENQYSSNGETSGMTEDELWAEVLKNE